ncbi:MAG: NAD(P)/FAD-dependent oxidoreductase [Aquabacterium sp.]|uniref:flavin monoamine oxidase family protein n=1 Tax=Aquabacterium sp. TaxID=1872578 RepID=UPI00271AE073|nr:NAD(P)/FAD-dependent oxidoreductase [Aquabacterium sp.]MDO9004681.1 NAD(P)/FAD-dependent oxidoreductase [Aquabacterium sp.]
MIDVAIVGAGLTGLALARSLQAQGLRLAVFEARDRVGGRIFSDTSAEAGARVDLGASWYWPDTEPRMAALVESLGLKSFGQPDQGHVLSLVDPARAPDVLDVQGIHGGARRLSGGMGQLAQSLHERLLEGSVKLGHRLVAVHDAQDHVELHFARMDGGVQHLERVTARRVVLTLPPRLLAQLVRFQPALSPSTAHALTTVPTWMAREAKAVARFERPFWHAQGQSGHAFVSHPQAVLREVWDASDEQGAALAGFCAMAPDTRRPFERSLPLLASSQFAQLFGPEAHADSVLVKDWSLDTGTCSELDRSDAEPMPPQADPLLRRPHWSGRLFFGGTETARHAAGHMEGALESAARLADFLRPAKLTHHGTTRPLEESLASFELWVTLERQDAVPRYRQHLNQMLARQDRDRVTQRAMLATAEQTYTRALEQLAALDLGWGVNHTAAPTGRSELTPQVLAPFSGFSKSLVNDALAFNASSCALSNFDAERRPDADYLQAITVDLAAAWREFAWATNDLLCSRSGPSP